MKGNRTSNAGFSVGQTIESILNIPAAQIGHTFNAIRSGTALIVFGGGTSFGNRMFFSLECLTLGFVNELCQYNMTLAQWKCVGVASQR